MSLRTRKIGGALSVRIHAAAAAGDALLNVANRYGLDPSHLRRSVAWRDGRKRRRTAWDGWSDAEADQLGPSPHPGPVAPLVESEIPPAMPPTVPVDDPSEWSNFRTGDGG